MAKPKGINKSKVGFSIDKQTYNDFEEYCECNNINKSKLIDKIIKKFLLSVNAEKVEKILNEYVK